MGRVSSSRTRVRTDASASPPTTWTWRASAAAQRGPPEDAAGAAGTAVRSSRRGCGAD